MNFMKTERIVFLDYLRAIACYMVIMVHTCEAFYFNLDGISFANNTDRLWVSFVDSALRACVPLFVMTSAYLLIPLKDDLVNFFKRRFIRVLIPFIVWALIYSLLPLSWGEISWSESRNYLTTFLYNFTENSIHFWYIYMLIGLYIFMPIISPWLKQVGKKEELFFLCLWFLTTFMNYIKLLVPNGEVFGECSWNDFHMVYYNAGYIGYLIMAHYIRTYINWNWSTTLKVAIPLFLVGYFTSVAGFYNLSLTSADPYIVEQPWRFCTPNCAMMTFALFIVFKKITLGTGFIYKCISSISRLSYGIYLMHYMLLTLIYKWLTPYLNTPETIFGVTTVTFIACYALSWLLQKLPKGKYIVG